MKIYVIVVVHNGLRHDWIKQCFLSVRKSTISCQIIAIDNNSSDESVSFMKSNFPDNILIETGENQGFGRANNLGLKKALDLGGHYFFLLNQDAKVQPDTIEKLVIEAEQRPEYGILSPIHLNGDSSKLDHNFTHYLSHGNCPGLISDLYFKTRRKFYEINFVNAAAWLISKKCLLTVGGFNPVFFMYGEDDNYIHRVHFHNLKVGLVTDAVIYHDREFKKPRIDGEFVKKIMDYSHPGLNYDLERDKSEVRRQIWKNILMLRFSRVRYFKSKMKALDLFPNEMLSNKILSMSKGDTFLN